MKAFLLGHLFLGPLTLFTIAAAFGYPLAGAIAGLAIGIAFAAVKYRGRLPSVFMIGQLVGLAAALIAIIANPDMPNHETIGIAFAFIALGALISIVSNKPWTIELSEGDYGDFAQNPAFTKANMMLSSMWVVIFAWTSVSSWFEMNAFVRWIPLIIGGLVSVFGPKAMMRMGIRRGLFEDPSQT